MSENDQNIDESQQLNPEQVYLEKAFKPKRRIRDENDIKYREQMKKLKEEKEKQYKDIDEAKKMDPDLFEPTQELRMEKEKIKREKLFAKQVIHIVKIGVTKINYELQEKENHLKQNLKEYQKQIKKQKKYTKSLHMQKAGISFIKKKEDQEGGGDGEEGEQQQNENQEQENKPQEVYVSVKYGNIEYGTDPMEPQQIEEPESGLNFIQQYSCDFQNEFEYDKQTQTIVYFTIKLKDNDEKYNKRYNWLKDRYTGDLVIGQGKLDLASLVIAKDKEEQREKTIKIWRYDENNPANKGEEIGNLNVNISYVKPDFEKPEQKKLKYNFMVSGLNADFSQADTTKLQEKFKALEQGGDLVPYAKVRIAKQTFKTDTGNGTSVTSGEEYKFNVSEEVQKMYVEVHLYNETIKFNECVGIAVLPFNKLNKPEIPNQAQIETDCTAPLSYKGKLAGKVTFKVTQYKEMQGKQKKKMEFKDMKELSKPDEYTIKRKQIIEQRHGFHQQKLFQLNMGQKKDGELDQSQDLAVSQFMTPQPHRKEEKTLRLPKLKQNQSSMLIQRPMMDGTLEGEYKMNPLKVSILKDNKYKQQIHGQGYSSWESSSTLQRSVPHFSMPKGARFQLPDNKVPGPNKYSSIGILKEMEVMDKKLQGRRLQEMEEYKKLKKELAQ